MAVRVEIAEDIELLHWERALEGTYTGKGKVKQNNVGKRPKKNAYTRILIGKIILHPNVGFIGPGSRGHGRSSGRASSTRRNPCWRTQ